MTTMLARPLSEIRFDDRTRDYGMYIHGSLIGFAATQAQAGGAGWRIGPMATPGGSGAPGS